MEFAQAVWEVIRAGVVLLLILTVIVAFHELGHYLFARLFGMEVKAFAVMMGGVRKTDLSGELRKPMAPAGLVWAAGALALVIFLAGAGLQVQALSMLGLFLLSVPLPIWVCLRLGTLYHLDRGLVMQRIVMCLGGALLILGLGTRFQGLTPELILGTLMGGSSVALMVLYYHPVLGRSDEKPMGHGEVLIAGESKEVMFRPVWHVTSKSGTEFSLLLLPLGGFAAMKGMHPNEEGTEVSIPGGFYNKPPWQRFLVLFAGPLFSLLLGSIIMFGLFTTYGEQVPSKETVVGFVAADSPAEMAGLMEGDRVTAINGEPVEAWFEMVQSVRTQVTEEEGGYVGIPIDVSYERDGMIATVTIIPETDLEPSQLLAEDGSLLEERAIQARLGVLPDIAYEPLAVGAAAEQALMAPVNAVVQVSRLFRSFQDAKENIGGPVSMANVTQQTVSNGVYDTLALAAALSIILGIMNLLPFPPLDGGQMMIAFVEMLRGGKRLSLRMQNSLIVVGMGLVALLMVASFAIDLGRVSDQKIRQEKAAQQEEVKEASP